MDREQKFEMLSVVGFGIHTRMRERLQEVVDEASRDSDLRRVLGPVYFSYEYFLDSPALLSEDSPTPTACAPFLRRLVMERDFMLVPEGGFEAMETWVNSARPLSRMAMISTTEEHRDRYWPDKFLQFPNAIQKSVVLRLLHENWRRIEINLLSNGNGPNQGTLEELGSELRREVRDQFQFDPRSTLSYLDGSVCLAAGFRRSFAKAHPREWKKIYDPDGGNSWLREFCACIYPWLESPKVPGDRLFETVACSISSHYLFFGELVVFLPPIADAVLRLETYRLFRNALHSAVNELYVPMLTLFENYQAETDFREEIERSLEPMAASGPMWAGALRKELWEDFLPFLESVGSSGRSTGVSGSFPSEENHGFNAAQIPFLRLARCLPPVLGKVRVAASDRREQETADEAQLAVEQIRDVLGINGGPETDEHTDLWREPLMVSLPQHILAEVGSTATSADGRTRKYFRNFLDIYEPLARRSFRLLSELELALVQLWAHRLARVHSMPKQVLDSLVFSRYLIASPGMVGRIRDAMSIGHSREPGNVKTAIIIGGPGSGKDTMARVVQLFCPGYRFGPGTALNMAMLRPKEAAVPLLLGVSGRFTRSGDGFSLQGLLDAALDPPTEETARTPGIRGEPERVHDGATEKAKNAGRSSHGYTFILDELNSLDIESQGALLRILENAELQPLGSLEPTRVNFLVVGIMNEDPDLIMKKRTLDRILHETGLFSGLLGEFLYEAIRGQRRLREDLYFRLARGGEIRIPDLRDRIEDIPILAFFFLKGFVKALPEIHRPRHWDVELWAYDELMNPANSWDGNIRELQAVCRRMLDEALKEARRTGAELLMVRRRHARSALTSL